MASRFCCVPIPAPLLFLFLAGPILDSVSGVYIVSVRFDSGDAAITDTEPHGDARLRFGQGAGR